MMTKILNFLFKPRVSYDPLVKIFIHQNALLQNFHTYQNQYPKLQIAPVLKSNAYGHGLKEVASILDSEHPPFFCVDSFYEALVLRQNRIRSPILVIGYARQDIWSRNTLKNLAFSILSFEMLREVAATLKRKQIFHLKIDTGMHRQGILPGQIPEALKLLKSNPNIVLEGICSHLANAYSPDRTYSLKQINMWNDVVKILRAQLPGLKYFHLTATAGTPLSDQAEVNVARIGIGLYGINTSPYATIELEPVLEMHSVLYGIKTIGAAELVGYSLLYETSKPTVLATVPVGYNEGVDLRLTNKGVMQVAGRDCPIVSRVSMNITTIDISEISEPELEQEVTIISRDPSKLNSIEQMARLCNTSPYEIVVHLNSSLRREIV